MAYKIVSGDPQHDSGRKGSIISPQDAEEAMTAHQEGYGKKEGRQRKRSRQKRRKRKVKEGTNLVPVWQVQVQCGFHT